MYKLIWDFWWINCREFSVCFCFVIKLKYVILWIRIMTPITFSKRNYFHICSYISRKEKWNENKRTILFSNSKTDREFVCLLIPRQTKCIDFRFHRNASRNETSCLISWLFQNKCNVIWNSDDSTICVKYIQIAVCCMYLGFTVKTTTGDDSDTINWSNTLHRTCTQPQAKEVGYNTKMENCEWKILKINNDAIVKIIFNFSSFVFAVHRYDQPYWFDHYLAIGKRTRMCEQTNTLDRSNHLLAFVSIFASLRHISLVIPIQCAHIG